MKWLIASILLIAGCVTYKYTATHNIGLVAVERPTDAQDRYGPTAITQTDTSYVFEDELVRINWYHTTSFLTFSIWNKTDHSLKIVWDEAAYVDANGASHRVAHGGVKYTDMHLPQPPSVIVRRGHLIDSIIPTDYVYLKTSGYWAVTPFFGPKSSQLGYKIVKAVDYEGASTQVLLPIEIEGVLNEYIFTFKVHDVTIKKRGETILPFKYEELRKKR